jgi:peptidyl-prolyl cis-trans isomerase SurA
MRITARILVFAFLAILPSSLVAAKIIDKIVAQVNDEIITLSELEQAMKYAKGNPGAAPSTDNEASRRQMLDVLIDRKLAKAEAKRFGLPVPEKELRKALDDIKQKNGFADDEALSKALAKDGMTLEQLRQQLSEQIQQDRLMALMVKAKPKISEAEIKRFYEENFKTPENRIHIKVITLPVPPDANAAQQEEIRAQAEKAMTEAQKGEDFDKLIKMYSKPIPGSPSGDLGYVRQADLDPKFFEFLSNLKQGEVVPLKTPQGFQIIKSIDAKMGQVVSLQEVKPKIEEVLEREQMIKLFSEHLKEARKRALIKITL